MFSELFKALFHKEKGRILQFGLVNWIDIVTVKIHGEAKAAIPNLSIEDCRDGVIDFTFASLWDCTMTGARDEEKTGTWNAGLKAKIFEHFYGMTQIEDWQKRNIPINRLCDVIDAIKRSTTQDNVVQAFGLLMLVSACHPKILRSSTFAASNHPFLKQRGDLIMVSAVLNMPMDFTLTVQALDWLMDIYSFVDETKEHWF